MRRVLCSSSGQGVVTGLEASGRRASIVLALNYVSEGCDEVWMMRQGRDGVVDLDKEFVGSSPALRGWTSH